jgi:hypothetical protein
MILTVPRKEALACRIAGEANDSRGAHSRRSREFSRIEKARVRSVL